MAQELTRRTFIDRTKKVALATPLLSLVGCIEDEADGGLAISGETMGTGYSVRLAGLPDGIDSGGLGREIDGLLAEVDRRMSTYRADSELSRLNAAQAGVAVEVSAPTRAVVAEALRISRLSGGAFDPTVGPLVDLWGFGPDGAGDKVPSEAAVASARATVGHDGILVQEAGDGSARLSKRLGGTHLDLSGVAKGYGVDQVARHLESLGVEDYLVEVGGEIRARGQAASGRPWRVGIEAPSALPGDLQQVIALDRGALATSGNYRIFFEADGRRYTHIVNPRTGRPVEHDLASASVVAETTMEADALSTSLLVMGPEAGMAFAKTNGIAAFFITGSAGSFSESASPEFARRFMA